MPRCAAIEARSNTRPSTRRRWSTASYAPTGPRPPIPTAREVSPEHALVVRVGYGDGDHVAEGRYAAAYELPRKAKGSRRREDLSPAERLAAIVGGPR